MPPGVAALLGTARCSDCPGKASARWAQGEWKVVLHHVPDCPSLVRAGQVHQDAATSVQAAAEQLNVALGYVRDGDRDGTVVAGVVTASRN
jgi:hypothetical protein